MSAVGFPRETLVIQVAVSVRRSFTFPADLQTTSEFFRDFLRVLAFLPNLHLVNSYGHDRYRVLFSAQGVGIYKLVFYCDLQVTYDSWNRTLLIVPLDGLAPVPTEARIGLLTGQAYYSSTAVFRPDGQRTGVDYEVRIAATIAKRLEWRLIPDRVVEQLANEQTRQRLSEMTDQFIASAVKGCRW